MNKLISLTRRVGRLAIAAIVLSALSVVAAPAQADLIISVDNAEMTLGAAATFDVKLRSTAPNLDFQVASFDYTLTLDNTANPGSLVEFSSGLSAGAVSGSPNYIFNSIATNVPSLTDSMQRLSVRFSDFDNNLVFSTAVDSEVVIGTFTVSSVSSAAPVVGDMFTVALSNVIITDATFTPFAGVVTPQNGTVTVAVPEPSSLGLLTLACGYFANRRRVRTAVA